MISPVMSQGLYGLQKSQAAMAVSAQQISGAGRPDQTNESKPIEAREIASSLIDMKQQQHLFDASAKVVAAANHTLGSLLDATA